MPARGGGPAHVIAENARTLDAAQAMRGGNAAALGVLMEASHASLREQYEVSSPALDAMVDPPCASGCHGARMTGAGFGGCAVWRSWILLRPTISPPQWPPPIGGEPV